ncbi:energy transducer TonB [Sesbania bispinosa]|nr:energy transducer TonB [Sesbania bispinosa]
MKSLSIDVALLHSTFRFRLSLLLGDSVKIESDIEIISMILFGFQPKAITFYGVVEMGHIGLLTAAIIGVEVVIGAAAAPPQQHHRAGGGGGIVQELAAPNDSVLL